MKPRALILEDEEEAGQLVKRILNKSGIDVDIARWISKAKTLLRENQYHYCFMDLNLPDGEGFEIVPVIKEHNPGTKIIIVSAHDGVGEHQEASKWNIENFIVKPFSGSEILSCINRS
jgi:DNA-binding response OmpR family regulator